MPRSCVKNTDEIRGDSILRVYGSFLCLTCVLSFFFFQEIRLPQILSPGAETICWPFWEGCWKLRLLNEETWNALLWFYLGVSILGFLLFLEKRLVVVAWWALLFASVFKLAIVFQDFQLRANQHYMAGFATAAFLFFPGKRRILKVLIVLFYVAAGFLKINSEWISGAALYKPVWFFHGEWIRVATLYVLVLEMILIWGIFARRAWIFWVTFVQLLVFHIFSWPIVGFFYPMTMFCLLVVYPLDRLFPPHFVVTGSAFARSSKIFLGFFAFLQTIPYLIPGDSALTGEGRLFALHMFDARVECEAYARMRFSDGHDESRDLYQPMSTRIRCDPIVYWNRSNALCRGRDRLGFLDFDLYLNSRKALGGPIKPILSVKNYCVVRPSYQIVWHNDWIQNY